MLGLPCLLAFCPGSLSRGECPWFFLLSDSWVTLGSSFCLCLRHIRPSVRWEHPSLCLFPRKDFVWQHRVTVCALSCGSVLKVGVFLTVKIGLVPLALSIWMPWNFTFFHNFKLVLHPWMPDWFVNNCPGFPGESVCPAVPVMLTVFCTTGKKRGRIYKSLRLDGVVKVFSISRPKIHKEPAFNSYFIKTFSSPVDL